MHRAVKFSKKLEAKMAHFVRLVLDGGGTVDGREVPQADPHLTAPHRAGRPWKADGTPQDVCAGWAALRARVGGAS